MNNFWRKLKKPIFASAAMSEVTDEAFRLMLVKYSRYGGADVLDEDGKFTRRSAKRVGGPDVIWTEFVSCDGLCSRAGKPKLLIDLKYSKKEKPIVVQLFGSKPDNFYKCAEMAGELGFDGIDINMGCPHKKIEKQGAGAALIKNPKLAQEIILATKQGAGKLPVSVKTRLGYKTNILKDWLGYLLETEPAAITIHGRTRSEKSGPPAHWNEIAKAVEIVKKYDSSANRPLVLGNGDVKDMEDAREKIKISGVDGVMVGRALIGNPWFFSGKTPDIKERLIAVAEHAELFEKIFKGKKRFEEMYKHFAAYCHGFDGAKDLRIKLMRVKSARETDKVIKDFLR
ncbi:MAG: tRNA-dihydrouridine synthase [Candidatus Pacebacteria bacterium]|nr:tRNA-dihydrouridine synthase [Candidatus Paceibacterota bacterium]